MKTTLLILFAIGFMPVALCGQGLATHTSGPVKGLMDSQSVRFKQEVFQSSQENEELAPVYFNYRRRKLICNGDRISGQDLVWVCRNISDSLIQEQIRRYDRLSSNKKWILNATWISAAGTFAMGSATSSTSQETSGFFAACSAVSALASGILAICSSIPHQKRKIIMFRDLPVAYNRYVEIQNNRNE